LFIFINLVYLFIFATSSVNKDKYIGPQSAVCWQTLIRIIVVLFTCVQSYKSYPRVISGGRPCDTITSLVRLLPINRLKINRLKYFSRQLKYFG